MRPPASILQASRKELRATEPQRRAELLGPGRGGDRSGRRWRRGRSCGRRREVRTELRTPARGADVAADAGDGDPERQAAGGGDAGGGAGVCEREQSQSGSWKCAAAAAPFTRSLTHSSSYPNGPAKGGPNSLVGPNSPYPTSRPASLIGRLIMISRNLSDDKFLIGLTNRGPLSST